MTIETKIKSVPTKNFTISVKTVKRPSSKKAKKAIMKAILTTPIDLFARDDADIPTINPSERAVNVLDKKPNEHDAKTVEVLVEGFMNDKLSGITKRNTSKKVVSYKNLPYYEAIPLRELLSALAVQRPLIHGHIKKIVENFDPKKVQYVNVLKIKVKNKYHYYIIDGQHTAVSYGVLAKWGHFADDGISADNWLDVEIKCQVIEFHNFTFAREHFLGINGEDKRKLVYFDKWKNYVLCKRQDNPNTVTKELYEEAFAKQIIMESYGIVPVHEEDDDNRDLPGAFVRVDLLKDLTDEEVHWWCQIHQWNWDYRSVDSIEVIPMINLRNKIKGNKSLKSKDIKEFVMSLGNIIRNISGSPAEFRRLAEGTFRTWHKESNPDEKIPSTPADASLALLLQIYYKHGGTFKNISKTFLEDYDDNDYTLFDALPQETQDLVG